MKISEPQRMKHGNIAVCYILTNSMEQNPSLGADSHWVSQGILPAFIIVFKRNSYWFLYSSIWIQSTTSCLVSLKYVL